jgi:AcrR family transcriptional regulator
VELGLGLIKSRPFDQMLVDEVIEAAGISKGLLFHYFPTKRDFQLAVVQAAAKELLAALEPDRSLDVLEQLRRGLEAYIGYIEQHPSSYIAIVRGAGSDDGLLSIFEENRDAVVQLIAEPFSTEPNDMLRLVIRGWIASVEESTFLWLRDRPCDREMLVELLLRVGLQLVSLINELGPGSPMAIL